MFFYYCAIVLAISRALETLKQVFLTEVVAYCSKFCLLLSQIRTKKALKIVINEYSHPWLVLPTARFQDAFVSQCMFILISDYEKVLFSYGVYNFSLVAMSTK